MLNSSFWWLLWQRFHLELVVIVAVAETRVLLFDGRGVRVKVEYCNYEIDQGTNLQGEPEEKSGAGRANKRSSSTSLGQTP